MEISEQGNNPYPFIIIDNFIDEGLAKKLSADFPSYDSPKWFVYDSPLEKKKSLNSWYEFTPLTYKYISTLLSQEYISLIEKLTGTTGLIADPGLHGGGWHIQGNGGLLNVHLDYALHPKLGLKRKFNVIIYLSDWEESWGGNLELWSHDSDLNKPKELVKTVQCKFNRAVIFDASMNSWHGFSDSIHCPDDKFRKSIAIYYHTVPDSSDSDRKRALYAPRKEQENQKEIIELIESRVK